MNQKRTRSQGRTRSGRKGQQAHAAGQTLTTHRIGAMPILDQILKRMRLEEVFAEHLPREDARTKVPTPKGLLVLVKNFLLSRDPLYGVGEWAAQYAPECLGLTPEQVAAIGDDRAGHWLDRLFFEGGGGGATLLLAVVTHGMREFGVSLDQMHNDSTSITVYGAYAEANVEKVQRGQKTVAITHGHNKDHRPDLKQLLYILTVSDDGGVPVHFRVESGNVVDDKTHRQTWDLLVEIAGRTDFLYVADSKLATKENMGYIHAKGGRFVTILPRTRSEDTAFRKAVAEDRIAWRVIEEKHDKHGRLLDRISASTQPAQTAEGYPLLWYHSTAKAQRDAAARADRIQRALGELTALRKRLQSPRTRFRQRAKVAQAVEQILKPADLDAWITVTIEEQVDERLRQTRRGPRNASSTYVKTSKPRFDIHYAIDHVRIARDAKSDGVFPLVTNDPQLGELDVLHAYKGQPTIEKRFSQLKTDFAVAPVYFKEVRRIQAFLGVYFFALMTQALLERELRQAMERAGLESLPLYPEGRPCRRPTARRIFELFDSVQRHTLEAEGQPPLHFVTALTPLQRRILRLLDINPANYGQPN